MSSILPAAAAVPGFAERRRRREAVLGALVPRQLVGSPLVAGLDFLVVAGPTPPDAVLPVLRLVASAEQIPPGTSEEVVSLSAVAGATRLTVVDSPDAARSAFAAGHDLVAYDVAAMISRALGDLAAGRPAPPVTGRRPLVLLSGMLGDATLWDGLAARIGSDVLPWPARIDLDDSVAEMAAGVLAAAPPRFALGGHSLGAIVALEIVRRAPDRVERLLLVNASARGPSEAQLQAWQAWRRRTESGEFAGISAELARATLGHPRRQDRDLLARNLAMAGTVGAHGFLRQLAAQATRPDSLDHLAAIRVPVLVVSGELDEICPPALQAELADRCPSARRVTLAGCGHMAPLEDPDALAGHVAAWLADPEPVPAADQ